MLQLVTFVALIVTLVVLAPPSERFGDYGCRRAELRLESVCGDLRGRHIWKVTNPNRVDIPFRWSYLVANRGSGVAVGRSATTFVAPRWGVCTIRYMLDGRERSDTEVANLRICR